MSCLNIYIAPCIARSHTHTHTHTHTHIHTHDNAVVCARWRGLTAMHSYAHTRGSWTQNNPKDSMVRIWYRTCRNTGGTRCSLFFLSERKEKNKSFFRNLEAAFGGRKWSISSSKKKQKQKTQHNCFKSFDCDEACSGHTSSENFEKKKKKGKKNKDKNTLLLFFDQVVWDTQAVLNQNTGKPSWTSRLSAAGNGVRVAEQLSVNWPGVCLCVRVCCLFVRGPVVFSGCQLIHIHTHTHSF